MFTCPEEMLIHLKYFCVNCAEILHDNPGYVGQDRMLWYTLFHLTLLVKLTFVAASFLFHILRGRKHVGAEDPKCQSVLCTITVTFCMYEVEL